MISLDINRNLTVSFKNFKNVIITIFVEFMYKAKKLCNCRSSFFPTSFLFACFFGRAAKSSLNKLLPWKRETKIGDISLDTGNKLCVTNIFEDVICDACDLCNAMYFTLFTITSIHNIGKYTKIRNSKIRWKVTQNIQGSKKREID